MAYLLKDISNNIAFNTGSLTANLGTNVVASSTVSGLNVGGTYLSNGVSALKIPADSSNNRPPGQTGYIRYNTDTNIIEYWNNSTLSWVPISEPAPSISTITPQYILQDVSSTPYFITGANFNAFSNVFFIGNTDLTVYPTASTTFVSNSQINTLITDAIADASNNTAFALKVVNINTGFSSTTANIIPYNKGPVWNTIIGSSLGTGVSTLNYTTGNTPFTDLSASDVPAPGELPMTYQAFGLPGGVSLTSLNSLGKLIGTMPSLVQSTLYNFTAFPQDASGSRGPTVSFNFTVAPAQLAVTGYTLTTDYTITYVDSSNNSIVTPSLTGYTIYKFHSTGITGFVTPNFDASINYLVVGGGGGGGSGNTSWFGAGGGAGGYRAGQFRFVRDVSYNIVVGAGGTFTASNNASGTNGGFSRLGLAGASGITSSGGGGGPGISSSGSNSGGSGSGGVYDGVSGGSTGGSGNAGGYTPVEGFAGGGYNSGGQGGPGGSALEKGNETTSDGPSGAINNITGTNITYASGGYGNPVGTPAVNNGTGNGGNGGRITSGAGQFGTNGSSGVVIIRFPSLLTFNPSFKGGIVTGFSPGQFTITYVNSGNTIVSAPVSGGFTIYSFLATTTGTFVPNFNDSSVDFLVIGGGGAGGSGGGDQVGAGGGGAGGFRTSFQLAGIPATSGGGGAIEPKLTLTNGVSYTVTVGAGGNGQNATNATGANGSQSVFSTISASGGGGGGSTGGAGTSGANGGSGGGANPYAGSAGTGTGGQGFAGFKTTTTSFAGGGGGGGASSTGGNSSGTSSSAPGGVGGTGLTSAITGTSVARAGGGGGGGYSTGGTQPGGTASSGGGNGASSTGGASPGLGTNNPGSPGTQNTGGGGGGAAGGGSSASQNNKGGSGGSGIVVIRFASF